MRWRSSRSRTEPASRSGLARLTAAAMPLSLIASQLLVAGIGLVMTRFLTPSAKGTFTAAYVVASIAYLCGGLSLPHTVLLRTEADQRLHIDAGVVRRVGVFVMIMAVVATSALARR